MTEFDDNGGVEMTDHIRSNDTVRDQGNMGIRILAALIKVAPTAFGDEMDDLIKTFGNNKWRMKEADYKQLDCESNVHVRIDDSM